MRAWSPSRAQIGHGVGRPADRFFDIGATSSSANRPSTIIGPVPPRRGLADADPQPGESSVPSRRMMSSSPFCPPDDPPARNRNLPTGRFKSSQITSRSSCRRACKSPGPPGRWSRSGSCRSSGSAAGLSRLDQVASTTFAVELALWPARAEPPRQLGQDRHSRCCAASLRNGGPDCPARRPASSHAPRRQARLRPPAPLPPLPSCGRSPRARPRPPRPPSSSGLLDRLDAHSTTTVLGLGAGTSTLGGSSTAAT